MGYVQVMRLFLYLSNLFTGLGHGTLCGSIGLSVPRALTFLALMVTSTSVNSARVCFATVAAGDLGRLRPTPRHSSS